MQTYVEHIREVVLAGFNALFYQFLRYAVTSELLNGPYSVDISRIGGLHEIFPIQIIIWLICPQSEKNCSYDYVPLFAAAIVWRCDHSNIAHNPLIDVLEVTLSVIDREPLLVKLGNLVDFALWGMPVSKI